MKKSKLIECFTSLDKEEMLAFSSHLENLSLRKEPVYYKLFKVLMKFYPEFPEELIERKKVYAKIFKGEAFNENKFFKLQTELIKVFEQFIVTYNFSKDKIRQQFDLLCFYQQKNLDKYFQICLREFVDLLAKMPECSLKNWYSFRMEEQVVIFSQKLTERKTDYQPVFDALIDFTDAEQLRWKNIASTNMFPFETTYLPNSLLYYIHSHLQELVTTNNETKFIEVYQWSEKFLHKFEKEYAREVLIVLLDFAIKKINSGNLEFYRHAFNIYNLFMQLGILTDPNGFITVATYKNYITTALKLKEIDAAKSFLEEHKSLLDPVFAEEVYAFNKANIAFEDKNYELATDLIIQINFKDIFYKLNARRLLLKAFFEMSEINDTYFELYYNTLNAFKKYIYTMEGIPEVYIEANKNFVNFTARIGNSQSNGKSSKDKILREIKNTNKLAEREWLTEKCESYLMNAKQ
jgi:hypothetical protein